MEKSLEPLVSVIIPVYKTEAYLEKCVRSVIEQTYKNLEIILVDDGSPDNCPIICDSLAAEDGRISVIHKDNGGLSDARNKGMSVCNGEYFFFVDSDDYIRKDAIKLLIQKALTTDSDLVCGDYCSIDEAGNLIDHGLCYSNDVFGTKEAIDYFITKSWGAWGKLYKRAVYEGILFPIGKIHEDEAIMLRILSLCTKIALISDEIYFYLQRQNSITSEPYSKRKMDWFYGWQENTRFIEHNYPQFLDKCICKAWEVSMYNIDHLINTENGQSELSDIYRFAHKYRRCIMHSHQISYSSKLRLWMFLHSNIYSTNNLYSRFYRAIGCM